MSTIEVNSIDKESGSTLTLGGSGTTVQPHASATVSGFGKVLQVVQAVKTDTGSFSSSSTNTFVLFPGMSVSITPSSTSSKVLVCWTANVTPSVGTGHLRLYRDTTSIFQGVAASNRIGSTQVHRDAATPYVYSVTALTGLYLDSPSTTSAVAYNLKGTLGATYSGTFYINQTRGDGDEDYEGRTASNIIAMEIAG
tara:strand:- start:245 stop:832 length:588 start_codon:yes stop_codon:yes gene_type:complete